MAGESECPWHIATMPVWSSCAQAVVGQEAPLFGLRFGDHPRPRLGIGDFKARTAPKDRNARIDWEGSETIGIRWNGDEGPGIGNPQPRGNATWFIVPEPLQPVILEKVEELTLSGPGGLIEKYNLNGKRRGTRARSGGMDRRTDRRSIPAEVKSGESRSILPSAEKLRRPAPQ